MKSRNFDTVLTHRIFDDIIVVWYFSRIHRVNERPRHLVRLKVQEYRNNCSREPKTKISFNQSTVYLLICILLSTKCCRLNEKKILPTLIFSLNV